MAEQDAPDQADPKQKPDLMRDWFSLWQSELSAMATDREAQEGWQRMTRAWTAAFAPPGGPAGVHDGLSAAGGAAAGAAASAWAAAAAHASGRRDAEFDRLVDRVAELERRIAALERRS